MPQNQAHKILQIILRCIIPRRHDNLTEVLLAMKNICSIIFIIIALSTACYAERLSVSAPFANIRSGPGSGGYDILWKAEQYYPIEVIEKKGAWYHFQDFEGDKGWISKSLVGKEFTVITKNEKSNIRSGPGTGGKYEILFTVEKGVPFKVLKQEGDWYNVQHADGDQGWIHKSLVW